MYLWLLFPFILQTVLMSADEYIFHRKRALPLWEKIGHPLDTISVLALYAFIFMAPYSSYHLKWFIGLAILSCLFITKDEFVHKHHCTGSEHWLHAVLFVNHPVLLISLGLCWPSLHGQPTFSWIQAWMPSSDILTVSIASQALMITGFLFYQIIYWNFLWKEQKA